MLEGKCPKCGYECSGWGLSFQRHQMCARCGAGLLISEDGQPMGVGYSPFSAVKELDNKIQDNAGARTNPKGKYS